MLLYLELPTHLRVPKVKSPFALNLNTYRNAHFRLLDKAKKYFATKVTPHIPDVVIREPVRFEYAIYMPTKRAYDVANVGSVIDKFTSDTLVSCNVMQDDNYEHLRSVTYKHGGIDRKNPRAELRIYEISSNTC